MSINLSAIVALHTTELLKSTVSLNFFLKSFKFDKQSTELTFQSFFYHS